MPDFNFDGIESTTYGAFIMFFFIIYALKIFMDKLEDIEMLLIKIRDSTRWASLSEREKNEESGEFLPPDI